MQRQSSSHRSSGRRRRRHPTCRSELPLVESGERRDRGTGRCRVPVHHGNVLDRPGGVEAFGEQLQLPLASPGPTAFVDDATAVGSVRPRFVCVPEGEDGTPTGAMVDFSLRWPGISPLRHSDLRRQVAFGAQRSPVQIRAAGLPRCTLGPPGRGTPCPSGPSTLSRGRVRAHTLTQRLPWAQPLRAHRRERDRPARSEATVGASCLTSATPPPVRPRRSTATVRAGSDR